MVLSLPRGGVDRGERSSRTTAKKNKSKKKQSYLILDVGGGEAYHQDTKKN